MKDEHVRTIDNAYKEVLGLWGTNDRGSGLRYCKGWSATVNVACTSQEMDKIGVYSEMVDNLNKL